MNLDEFVYEIAPILKTKGYIKNRLTWVKKKEDISLIFNIQRSQFGKDIWYYNFGISINALLKGKNAKSFSDCHASNRLDKTTENHTWKTQEIVFLLDKWEVYYGSMEQLHNNALHGKYPQCVQSDVIQYISCWKKNNSRDK